MEARDIAGGDTLLLESGVEVAISDVCTSNEHLTVYNLSVRDFHTYAAHERGVLVHNKGSAEGTTPPQTQEAGMQPSVLSLAEAHTWDPQMPYIQKLEQAGISRASAASIWRC